MASIDKPEGFIRLSFGPKWKYVACVRSFIQNFLSISIADSKKADKISLAVSELVENAVKYNSKENTNLKVEVSAKNSDEIIVETENFSTAENIEVFKQNVSKIYEKSPLDAYIEKMKEAVSKSGSASQLGLARIRCESNCDISFEIKPDNILSIKTIFH
jgi:hypothetical protein